MTPIIKILHLEDLNADAELVARELKKSGLNFKLLWVTNKKDFEEALKDFVPDIIISDHSLPSFTSIDAFKMVKEAGITAPFILVTATMSEDFAVSRIKDGVTDYLLKDRLERLPSAVTNAIERHKAEEERNRYLNKIIENEKQLRKTEKLARLGSWRRDIPTGWSHWSDEIYAMFGYEPNEVVPTVDLVITHVHPDDRAVFQKIIAEAVQKEENSKLTFRITDKSGNLKWIYCELRVEFDANGDPAVLRGFNQDITEQKKAEETLRKSEANLTAIVENTDANIYSIDENLRYLAVNSVLKNRLLRDFGIEVKPGDDTLSFFGNDEESKKQWRKIYAKAFSGEQQQFTQQFTTKGVTTFTSFSITPVWENGKVIALSCYARDITAQKMAEEEIRTLNESLEKKVKERTAELVSANKELEAFSYTVAHDLRAPLRVINGFVGILENDHAASLNDEGKYLLSVITQNSQQMSQLVADLLELSRVGRVMVSPVSCNMHEIAEQAIAFIKTSDPTFRACIKLLPLPEAKCDPHLIKQVWLNLISNAVKYSGKVEHPQIEIGYMEQKNGLAYYVKDNGAGFDMALASKLFHPFQRLHKRSDYEGTGVGLALSHVIVTKHGGDMWADAKPGKGATFFFHLPN